jgi:predicted transcriptional regulator
LDSYFGFLNSLCPAGKQKVVLIEMPPSKLDRYLNVLQILVNQPQRIDRIERQANMGHEALKRHLDFLLSNGVIEERKSNNKQISYAITERGMSVFKTLRAFKYFEKLKESLLIVEEAREIASALSKHSRAWKQD